MDWVKLWTELLTHKKWVELSKPARVMLVQAWMWSGQNETDGWVPDAARKLIDYTPSAARELEAGGWLHRNGKGWWANDWEDHQKTADQLAETREQNKDRQRRWRDRQKEQA